jgi:uncharacterized membrane protein (UPF0136 family)
MNINTVLWTYIALLLVGGFMGFLKGRSKVSLIAAFAFAVPLALCARGIITQPIVPKILIGLLLVVFGMRLAKTKKFMPSGLMIIVSAVALVALFLVK